jgi:hypothetical protein
VLSGPQLGGIPSRSFCAGRVLGEWAVMMYQSSMVGSAGAGENMFVPHCKLPPHAACIGLHAVWFFHGGGMGRTWWWLTVVSSSRGVYFVLMFGGIWLKVECWFLFTVVGVRCVGGCAPFK